MAFRAQKLNIDLTLDLTEYIPEKDGGILTTEKTDPESIKEWYDFAIKEGENIQKLSKQKTENDDSISLSELTKVSEQSVMKQIDYFYGKGEKFYKKIPSIVLQQMLEYINGQLMPAKKK